MNHPRPPAPPEHLDPGFEPTQTLAPSHDALPAGTRLAEYEVERVLGEGGFGIVYLAADHGLQRHVAIKEYLPAALAARGARASVTLRATSHNETFKLGLRSFVNEARLLARFDHPSLVRVYRFWEANGTAYMVMPYYEGTTLAAARMAMTQPPDETWLRNLLLSLMGALEVLHASSCYHRDIAPDNILLLPDGRPVLLDFGAARRVIGDRTQTLTAILKPAFAPIEQYAEAGHLQQGPWTDLYALGAVMYYLISGRSPVPSTVRAVDDQLKPLAEVAESLRQTFPDLRYSASFLSAIEWALSVRPKDRPQTVAQLRDALSKPGWTRAVPAPEASPSAAPSAAAPEKPAVDHFFASIPPQAPLASPAAAPAVAPAAERAPAPPPAAAPTPAPASAPAARSAAAPPTLSDEVPSDAAVMAALNAALGSIPPSRPDPAWGAMRPDDDDVHQRARAASSAGTRWGIAFVLLAALGVGAWQWQEHRTAEELLRRLANTSLDTEEPPPRQAAAVPPVATEQPAQERAELPPVPAPAPQAAPAPPAPAPAVAAAPTPEAAPVSTRSESEDVAAATEEAQIKAAPPAAGPVAAPAAPAAPAEPPVKVVAPAPALPSSPRAACGSRSNFSLYYCMQQQCRHGHFFNHPQCIRLREHDEVE